MLSMFQKGLIVSLGWMSLQAPLYSQASTVKAERQNGGDGGITSLFINALSLAPKVLKRVKSMPLKIPEAIPVNLVHRGVTAETLKIWIRNNIDSMMTDIPGSPIPEQTEEQTSVAENKDKCAVTGSTLKAPIYISISNCEKTVNTSLDAVWVLINESTHHHSTGRESWSREDESKYAATIRSIIQKTFEDRAIDEEEENLKERMHLAVKKSDLKAIESLLSDIPAGTDFGEGKTLTEVAVEVFNEERAYALQAKQALKVLRFLVERGEILPARSSLQPLGFFSSTYISDEVFNVRDEYAIFLVDYFEKDPAIIDHVFSYSASWGRVALFEKMLATADLNRQQVSNAAISALSSARNSTDLIFQKLMHLYPDLGQELGGSFLTSSFFSGLLYDESWYPIQDKKLQILIDKRVPFKSHFVWFVRIFEMNVVKVNRLEHAHVLELWNRLIDHAEAFTLDLNKVDEQGFTGLDWIALYKKLYLVAELKGFLASEYPSNFNKSRRIENLTILHQKLVDAGATHSSNCFYIKKASRFEKGVEVDHFGELTFTLLPGPDDNNNSIKFCPSTESHATLKPQPRGWGEMDRTAERSDDPRFCPGGYSERFTRTYDCKPIDARVVATAAQASREGTYCASQYWNDGKYGAWVKGAYKDTMCPNGYKAEMRL